MSPQTPEPEVLTVRLDLWDALRAALGKAVLLSGECLEESVGGSNAEAFAIGTVRAIMEAQDAMVALRKALLAVPEAAPTAETLSEEEWDIVEDGISELIGSSHSDAEMWAGRKKEARFRREVELYEAVSAKLMRIRRLSPASVAQDRAPAPEWQPIATAPTDGTNVLLWWPFWCAGRPTIGWFGYKGIQQWVAPEALDGDGDPPTHWMPLPVTPRTGRGE